MDILSSLIELLDELPVDRDALSELPRDIALRAELLIVLHAPQTAPCNPRQSGMAHCGYIDVHNRVERECRRI